MIGSPEAVDGATQLLDICAELLGLATTPGEEQQQALQAAGKRVIDTRQDFIEITRKELGKEATAVPVEDSQRQVAATDAT
jgi:hypothetical protein